MFACDVTAIYCDILQNCTGGQVFHSVSVMRIRAVTCGLLQHSQIWTQNPPILSNSFNFSAQYEKRFICQRGHLHDGNNTGTSEGTLKCPYPQSIAAQQRTDRVVRSVTSRCRSLLFFVCVLQLRSGLRRGHGNDLPEGSKPVGASRGPDNRIFRSGLGKLTIEICKDHHGLWADAVVF
jgi:hypothetical protein